MTQFFETDIYVRYSESDAQGHVNNTSHFLYLEEGRTKFFDVIQPMRDTTFSFIAANISCSYINEAFPREILTVRTAVKKIGNKSFTLYQDIINKEKDLTVAEAEAVLVCYDRTIEQSVKIPDELIETLQSRMLVHTDIK